MNCVADPLAGVDTTIDAFHRGAFHLVQPKDGHHRAGLDAMLLASCVESGFTGEIADLGAGAGAAGLAALARCAKARALLVEREPVMVACARASLALPENAALASRANVLAADVTLDGLSREGAGLTSNRFGWVIANPPFNDARDRQTPDAAKAAAHVIEPDTLAAWIKTAAAITAPSGHYAMIARPHMLPTMLAAMERRFGGIAIRPVHPTADNAAIRVLVAGVKGSRARLGMLPAVVLHAGEGFTPQADDLINGGAELPMSVV